MKTAIVEAGHWHAPSYFAALKSVGHEASCWSESDPAARARRQQEHPGKVYDDYRRMLEAERSELILAFGVHDEMTQIAADLVAMAVPFSMEKPMGLDPDALEPVVRAAEQKGAFAGADLVMRQHPIFARLGELRDAGELGRIKAWRFTLLAGGPHRYVDWGVEWMLQPERSGGPLFNFGPHGVDLFLWLCGEDEAEIVAADAISDLHNVAIDDYVTFTVRTPRGAVGVFEVGYAMLQAVSQQGMCLMTDRLVATSSDGSNGEIVWREDERTEKVEGKSARDSFVAETIERLETGREPIVALRAMLNTLRVLRAVGTRVTGENGSSVGQDARPTG